MMNLHDYYQGERAEPAPPTGGALRALLIRAGVLVPRGERVDGLRELHPSTEERIDALPHLALDDAGRRVAARDNGRSGDERHLHIQTKQMTRRRGA